MNLTPHALTYAATAALLCTGAFAQGANLCANADVIPSAPASVAFDTNSPSDTPGVPATTTLSSSCGSSNEVWFTFTPAASGAYQFDTCGGTFDTELTIYSGSCNAPVELGCNDDYCGTQSQLLFGLIAGTQYFISLGYWDPATSQWGAGTLNVTEVSFPPASGSLTGWGGAVLAGTQSSYLNGRIPGPMVADIGMTNGANGVTYEFIVHGTNEGVSSCLLGALGPAFGDSAGLKFEQYLDTMSYGVTEFGVVDNTFSAVANQENIDVHLAFVVDTASVATTLYVNGNNVGTVASAPVLQGLQGLGMIYRGSGPTLDAFYGIIRAMAVYESALGEPEVQEHANAYFSGGIGTQYCAQTATNQAGTLGELSATGTTATASNDVTLVVTGLPNATFGYFLVAPFQGLTMNPNGARGNLCLSGSVGRYVGPGQIQNTQGTDGFSLQIDVNLVPTPVGFVSAMPGDTWNFQAWHRDVFAGALTSNFTNGLELVFN